MKRNRIGRPFAALLLALALGGGCGTDRINHALDLGQGGDAATPADGACPTACSGLDICSTGACDTATGKCVLTPSNEGGACPGGSCVKGVCTPPTSCWCPPAPAPCNHLGSQTLTCTPQSQPIEMRDFDDFSNALPAHLSGPVVMNAIETYACAASETAPETAYHLEPLAADKDITVTLTVTSPFPADMSPPNTDLDLIILEGDCSGVATCVNPTRAGGYQGITVGTGNETVTFHAVAGHDYYFVVDGHDGGAADYHIQISCL